MNTKMYKGFIASIALTSVTGCATIMGKSAPETINIRSTPDQAQIIITDESGIKIFEGKTPTSLPLEKKRDISAVKNMISEFLRKAMTSITLQSIPKWGDGTLAIFYLVA